MHLPLFFLETCSFLAGILAWKDPHVLVPALQIADILMEKLPETFSKMFVREGVVHAVDQLILPGNASSAQPSAVDKDNDSITGSSSRSRRYRRRAANATADGSSVEESKNPLTINIGSPPGSIEISANPSHRTTVSACAKAFKHKYFPSGPGAEEIGVTEDLLHLKNLCMKLNVGVDDQKTKAKGKYKACGPHSDNSSSKDDYLAVVVSEMLAELRKGDGVSTFEFIGSGVVGALLNYFSCGHFSKERICEASISELRQQALQRYKSFVSVALPCDAGEGPVVPMTILVQKLQNALSSLERFPVVLSHSSRPSASSGRLSSGLGALFHPLKLRLCRAQGEKSIRDYSSNVVLIDPLATLAAVEDFLWPRVQRSESSQKPSASVGNNDSGVPAASGGTSSPSTSTPGFTGRRHSLRSRSSVNIGDNAKKDQTQEKSAGSSKGKGKAVLKHPEEGRGPQTRNATRRRAELDKDAQMKPVEGDSSSEVWFFLLLDLENRN